MNEASVDADMMRGMSYVRCHKLRKVALILIVEARRRLHYAALLSWRSRSSISIYRSSFSFSVQPSNVNKCQAFSSRMAQELEIPSPLSDPEERRVLFAALDSFRYVRYCYKRI